MSDLLRLATAGSVDDGKSTLVGRLLYDTKSVLADQIDAVTRASVDRGLDTPDLSLLVDGLRAEREQGITIDVAYRYFATPKRTFVLADTPGHVQYTRNTVSGASTAQLVILLVDARKGVIAQTRRHAAVLALLGVPKLVLAVNKIDLVENPEEVFTSISAEFNELTSSLGWASEDVVEIPVSALHGDNVAIRSDKTPYYTGPTLIEHLESIPVDAEPHRVGLRFPVQYVIRPRTAEFLDYRGYAGQVAAGSVVPGDEVVILPSGTRTTVTRIDTADGELDVAHAGRSVTLILADDVDVSRGDTIASPSDAPRADRRIRRHCLLAGREVAAPPVHVCCSSTARERRRPSWAAWWNASTSRTSPRIRARTLSSSTRSARSPSGWPSRSWLTTTRQPPHRQLPADRSRWWKHSRSRPGGDVISAVELGDRV